MDKEIHVLELKNPWNLTSSPLGKIPIGDKWVYKIKYHFDGGIRLILWLRVTQMLFLL